MKQVGVDDELDERGGDAAGGPMETFGGEQDEEEGTYLLFAQPRRGRSRQTQTIGRANALPVKNKHQSKLLSYRGHLLFAQPRRGDICCLRSHEGAIRGKRIP